MGGPDGHPVGGCPAAVRYCVLSDINSVCDKATWYFECVAVFKDRRCVYWAGSLLACFQATCLVNVIDLALFIASTLCNK